MKKIIVAMIMLSTAIAHAQFITDRCGYAAGSQLEAKISMDDLKTSQWDEESPLPLSVAAATKIAKKKIAEDYPDVTWAFSKATLIRKEINEAPGYYYQIRFVEDVTTEEIKERVKQGDTKLQNVSYCILLNSKVIELKKKNS